MLYDGTVQAGSTFVPELFLHKTLSECLSFLKGSTATAEKSVAHLALDNKNPTMRLQEALSQEKGISEVIAAIGSERGWTDNERQLMENHGYIRCGMGERIMRTETAATVAASIILNEMGVLC